jgi:hypothetical protein
MTNGDNGESLTWAHVGDLHITGEDDPNYRDFLSIIEAINWCRAASQCHHGGRVSLPLSRCGLAW